MIGEYNSNGEVIREYIYLGNQPIAMLSNERDDEVLQIHTDHLGTPRVVTDKNKSVLWRMEGDQFGDVQPQVAEIKMPLRHAGQYADDESGLFYNYFRYYDPSTGRYVTSDPIGLEGGLNTFGYVGGSPVHFTDSLGLQWDNAGPGSVYKINLMNPRDKRHDTANRDNPKPDICNVYGHGAPGVFTPDTRANQLTIKQPAKEINMSCPQGQPVQLWSCDGGAGGNNSVANKLAEEFCSEPDKCRDVYGWDDDIWYRPELPPVSADVLPPFWKPFIKNIKYSHK